MVANSFKDIFVKKLLLQPILSIIIPCYNQSNYLEYALHNLDPLSNQYEVIIINDGSTRSESAIEFKKEEERGFTILHQKNKGLAAARNTGIAAAKVSLILPLDADNCIENSFIYDAINVFNNNPKVAVVYSDAEFFDGKTGRWVVGEFNLQKLMIANYIDACAMVRKNVFEQLGGYDEEMKNIKTGWEDWDMWLKVAFANMQFHYLPQIGFKYRVTANSMITNIQNSNKNKNLLLNYMQAKYPAQLGMLHMHNFVKNRFKPHPILFIIKLVLYSWFPNLYKKLV